MLPRQRSGYSSIDRWTRPGRARQWRRRCGGDPHARQRRHRERRIGGEGDGAAALEHADQLVGVLEALRRRLGHHLPDDLEQLALLGILERRGGNLLHDVLVADGEGILTVERHATGETLVGHDAQRINVAATVERLRLGLLGTHVVRRADRHSGPGQLAARRRLRDAEVGDHRVPVLIEHDVVGLDVAMDDFLLVGVGERAAHFGEDLLDLGGRQYATRREDAGERLAPQKLHHEVNDSARFPDPVNRDDVRVFELRRRARLALEPLDEFLVERERERQHLDRDFAVELLLFRLEHDRHAAAPQLFEDFVLRVELLAHHVDFGDVRRLGAHAGGRHRRQVEAARVAELRGVLILGATARAVQSDLRGDGANLGFAPETVNRKRQCFQKSAANAA